MRKIRMMISEDFEKQRSGPLLFPDKAGDDMLERLPPTIIWEQDFDMFITEAGRMTKRMRAERRLLEFVVLPACLNIFC